MSNFIPQYPNTTILQKLLHLQKRNPGKSELSNRDQEIRFLSVIIYWVYSVLQSKMMGTFVLIFSHQSESVLK